MFYLFFNYNKVFNDLNEPSLTDNQKSSSMSKAFDNLVKLNDLAKLNDEIDGLKSQLEYEIKRNIKLSDEIRENTENERLFEKELDDKSKKLKNMELELEEKNLLINKLLTENKYESTAKSIIKFDKKDQDDSDELNLMANMNHHEIESSTDLNVNIKNMIKSLETSKKLEEKSNFLSEYFELKDQYSKLKIQIQSVKTGLDKFIE
jgi:hypothetical protein